MTGLRPRRWAGPVLALLLLGAGLVAAGRDHDDRRLDPRSYGPSGAHALAVLLAARGHRPALVTDPGLLRPGPDLAVLVPSPDHLGPATVAGLRRAGARVVLVAPEQEQLDAAGVAVDVTGPEPPEVAPPDCASPVPGRAGAALTGGLAYVPRPRTVADGCYPADRGSRLLLLDGGRTALLGSGDALENAALDRAGDAALALGLLDAPRVAWLVPPAPPLATGAAKRGLLALVPDGVVDAALLLGLAALLLAAARGRRWGRLVVEPLPVVVPAAEAVEGAGRLYAAARARGHAAERLRAASRLRLATVLRLPADAPAPALAAAVAARTARDPATTTALLYGPEPPDDRALVALAHALDETEAEVRQP